ncbi:zinc finger protein 646 isoform X2 [Megalops cyprinoides]|nr:zinc finger protein 646 isoform X2 [Megalops cyprinoides]
MATHEPGRTKGFSCKHCDTVWPSMPRLLEHMETHYQKEEERKFKCDQCGRGYRHPGSLTNHKKTHDVGSFQCQVCSRKLSNLLALKNHLRLHTRGKNFCCSQCRKVFRLASQLAAHQKVHSTQESSGKSGTNEFQLKTVGNPKEGAAIDGNEEGAHHNEQAISLPTALSDSVLDIVPGNSLNGRRIPDINPNSSAENDRPISEDNRDRPFKCDQCKRTYRHHGSLINHKKSHQLGVFDCPVCFKQFSNLAALKSHQRIHMKSKSRSDSIALGISESPDLSESIPQNGDMAVHFCHLCEVGFPNDSDFQDHILLHNTASLSLGLPAGFSEDMSYDYSIIQSPDANLYPPSLNDSPHLPPLLDRQENFNQMLQSAANGHTYTCAYCGQGHTDLDSFKLHYLTHDPPLPYNTQVKTTMLDSEKTGSDSQLVCPTSTNKVKAQELSVVDNSERRFKCQICSKSYRHAGSLINHKHSHQTGIYQCSICRKHYPHLAALRSHLRIHKARPATVSLSSDGDWLSPEPLTLEGQHSDLHTHDIEGDEANMLSLTHDSVEAAHMNLDSSKSSGLEGLELHEPFDTALLQDRPKHLPLLQSEPPVERHMCADCGETYADIAGIKSHMCSHWRKQHEAMSNGFLENLEVQDPGEKSVLKNVENKTHIYNQAHKCFRESDIQESNYGEKLNGEDEDGEEDDEEVYQCSVCRNHYTSMRALRSHLRGHTHSHSTSTSTGPSSLSSLEKEVVEPGESQEEQSSLIICSTCGESFSREQDLQTHQLMHNQGTEGKDVQSKGGNNHCTSIKKDERMICGVCGVACRDYLQLETHLCTGQERGGKKNKEKEAAAVIVSRVSGDHQKRSDSGDRPHKCDQCGRAYRHAGSLLNHKKSHKTGVFRCFVCQKRFYNLLALKNHQRTHFDVKRHKCDECGKAFKIQKQLMNHLRIHQEHWVKTQELNKQFKPPVQINGTESEGGTGIHSTNDNMDDKSTSRSKNSKSKNHRATVLCDRCGETHSCKKMCSERDNEVEMKSGVKLEEGETIDLRPYACDQCGRTYRHAGSLVNHKNSHKTGEYYCAVCNNTYSNQLAMKNHLRIHFAVKKHTCQDCGKAFRGQKQLSSHVRSHSRKKAPSVGAKGVGDRSAKEGNYSKCKECPKVFTSTDQLSAHACGIQPSSTSATTQSQINGMSNDKKAGARAHQEKEDRPFGCNICGRTYRHAGSLLNHKNTHKMGHFKCSFCAKPFSNPMALRNHARIHTQKKKHVCASCGKAFRLASVLHNHQKIHIQGKMHFSCSECSKSFRDKSGLKRHHCQKNQESNVTRAEGGERCFT